MSAPSGSRDAGASWFKQVSVGAIIGVSSSIVSAVVLAIGLPWMQDRLRDPTCDDPRGLALAAKPAVTASSTYVRRPDNPVERGLSYGAENVLDGDAGTAWVEGRTAKDKEPLGINDSLVFVWDKPQDLQMVCVVNGYAKSWDVYRRNASVRLATVTTDRGDEEEVGLQQLGEDTFIQYQPLKAPKGSTNKLTFTIVAVHSGVSTASARFPDTALSEVEFWVKD
jgi:hypothetical protein